MKYNFKISTVLGMFLFLLFSGCQQDDFRENKSDQTEEVIKVSASELLMILQNPDIKKTLFKASDLKKSNSGLSDFDLYFEKLGFEEYDNYSVFLNDYSTETPYYKTLIITIDNKGGENAFYVQYSPNQEEHDATKPFNIKKFNGRMDIFDLDMNPRASWLLHQGTVAEIFDVDDCKTTVTISVVPCSHKGNHSPGETCDNGNVNDSFYQVTVRVDCGFQFKFAAGGTSGGVGSGGGGGGGGAAADVIFENNYLNADQIKFLNANPIFKAEIHAYLKKVGYAVGTGYAVDLIKQTIETGLKFDVERSSKSPAYIDITAVSGNTPEEVKFREVYDKLSKSPKFKKLFVDLFGASGAINVIFDIGNLSSNNDGETKWVPTPKGIWTNRITLTKNLLLGSSDIRIARVIIHECIHAYLNIKLKNPNIGMSISDINDMDFIEVINTLYNGLHANETQHDFFVDHMVPVMAEILSESKQLLLTPAQIAKVDNPDESGIYIYKPTNTIPPTNSGIPTPWVWADFFKYISLEGLHQTDHFDSVYPQNSVEYYYFMQYQVKATIAFMP